MAVIALTIAGSCVTLLVINRLNETANAFELAQNLVVSFVG